MANRGSDLQLSNIRPGSVGVAMTGDDEPERWYGGAGQTYTVCQEQKKNHAKDSMAASGAMRSTSGLSYSTCRMDQLSYSPSGAWSIHFLQGDFKLYIGTWHRIGDHRKRGEDVKRRGRQEDRACLLASVFRASPG